MTAVVVGLALVVLLLGILVAGLLRSHAEILRLLAQQGTPVHAPSDGAGVLPLPDVLPLPVARPGLAPVAGPGAFPAAAELLGSTPDGDAAALSVAGGQVLLAFLSSQCLTCQTFWRALDRADVGLAAEVIVVTKGPEVEVTEEVARLAGQHVNVLMSSQAWRYYEVPVSPYFVHVLDGRVVGTGAASRWEQVVGLVRTSLAGGLRPGPVPAAGTAAAAGAALGQGGRIEPRGAQDRADAVDAELRAAGIEPGDPRLWPTRAGRP